MQNLLGLFNGHRLKNAHKVFVVCQLSTGHVVYVSAFKVNEHWTRSVKFILEFTWLEILSYQW